MVVLFYTIDRWQVEDILLLDFYTVKAEKRSEQLEVLNPWQELELDFYYCYCACYFRPPEERSAGEKPSVPSRLVREGRREKGEGGGD
ncbi:hypothetical protein FCM35_KLT10842 [Carex littledalei]|uniref:Uncharacterized protein n=1 Tax=Carex littledalei TaxID=544730 RepID=A0A833QD52_9POAL|nr:hypothetical protein FCM35_KLT10842 [Carex littledalei]